jgi:hypothetical protein
MGQSGQIVREFAIRALERESEVGTHRREGYGASQDHTAEVRKFGIEYVRSINQATFALCPPGNISGFTFRSYEVMLMNRIPLSLNYVTSDPNFLNPYSYSHMFKATRSWKNFLGEVQELDEAKILFLQELNRGKAISDLQALKEGLN